MPEHLSDPGYWRAQVTIRQAHRADVDTARAALAEYVEGLRGAVRIAEAGKAADWAKDGTLWVALAALDPLRLRAQNALYAVNPNLPWRTDFEPLVQTNLRTQAAKLLAFIAEPNGDNSAALTMRGLDARAADCGAVIDRFQHDADADLLAATAYAGEGLTLRALLAKWRHATEKNPVARVFWWVFADHVRLTIYTLIIAALAALLVAIRHR